jgi:hypothetical protein
MLHRLLVGFCVALSVLFGGAHAHAEISAQLGASVAKVEVGRPLRIELNVSSDEGSPESPRLTIPNGFGLRGPSVSTQFSASLNGWSAQTKRSITATWEVNASKTGTFTIGPAQAFVEGKSVSSNAVTIEVVPAGTLPVAPAPAPRRGLRSPFDDDDFPFPGFPGFGRPGRSMLDDLLQQQIDEFPQAPPEFQVSAARDRTAFLEATITPEHPVVGQQVTLRIVAYGAKGRFRESDTREPRRADFFSMPLQETSNQQQLFDVRVGDTDYLAVKIREFALFPLKSGKLEIGPMKMAFYGSNYVSARTGQPIERESKPLYVDVADPPAQGRPIDYQLGDVGAFKLDATVSPKTLSEGDSFSVVATLQGQGHLPEALRVPEQTGLEWLKPTLTEHYKVTPNKHVVGKRTFTYIVKATRQGKLDLGQLTLPYFNPDTGKYELASAPLGSVTVSPNDRATIAATSSTDAVRPAAQTEIKLSELAAARTELRPFSRQSHWTQSPWLWPLLLGLPLAVVAGQFANERGGQWLRRRRQQRSSLGGRVTEELKKAQLQHGQADRDGALATLERALFLALENVTHVKARAVLRDQLTKVLSQSGITVELASQVAPLLTDLEAARFTKQGEVGSLLTRTRALIDALPAPKSRQQTTEVGP